jgi:hypothetical protein
LQKRDCHGRRLTKRLVAKINPFSEDLVQKFPVPGCAAVPNRDWHDAAGEGILRQSEIGADG